MKRILHLLFIILTLSLFATSCQSDKPTNEVSEIRKKQIEKTNKKKANQKKLTQRQKANQKKLNQRKKANQKKAKSTAALPPISQLKKSEKNTHAFIKTINDKNAAKDKQPFRITENKITIKGMAIDKPRKTAAAGVYVKIGDQFFKTDYGQPQRAYAERAKNMKYLKSGFTLTIPKNKIENGDYDVSLYVVSSDKKNYYETAKKVKVKIR